MIHFLQPIWLLALIPVAALGGLYLWRQLHRRSYAMRFSNLELLRSIAPKGIGLRRHASAIALLACLGALSVGLAKPAVEQSVPLERATIVLAIDVSLSMQADDVAPTRIEAAQLAAKSFVGELPASYNLGLVSFAKSASVLVSPTKDRAEVMAAIDGLQLDEATATGEAVFTALDALDTVPKDGAQGPPPARILLLSDGYRTYGRTVEEAAAAALEAQVPVSTIAFGTDEGMVEIGGMPQRVPVDRVALADLAETTGGYYAEAASVSELKKVYEDMGSSIGHRTEPRDLTYLAMAAALLCGLLAGGFSLLWGSRLP
ncbi:Ca-activated chloride channel family protein [Allocatelliglobosispora scoriae]|uniref:Ca-activated chloride channel family protein n=1 Tax=Allocatelliglobosispora scoriae TaxID=643052 RepID=A0A841BLP0_9ACTN|nr:VWA domain-containing protein [Allocatelliglobosispora scoriae]MBB5869204.1 Ca-activated chloride channel family protein [Allocatelliglobosispora scoriae]